MNNPWRRYGFFYEAHVMFKTVHGYSTTATRKLDFVSYHLIKLYHGEAKLVEMALKRPEKISVGFDSFKN